jgi:hypothetical protein
VDLRVLAVSVVFGGVMGLVLGRRRDDRRAILIATGLTALVGMVSWLAAGSSVPAVSLGAGGATALVAALLAGRDA